LKQDYASGEKTRESLPRRNNFESQDLNEGGDSEHLVFEQDQGSQTLELHTLCTEQEIRMTQHQETAGNGSGVQDD